MKATAEAKFHGVKIAKIQMYGELVQIDAHMNGNERFPPCFRFIHKGNCADRIATKYKVGQFVNIRAEPRAYHGRVYGKLGKVIHYPNGRVRWTTKDQYLILDIKLSTEEV